MVSSIGSNFYALNTMPVPFVQTPPDEALKAGAKNAANLPRIERLSKQIDDFWQEMWDTDTQRHKINSRRPKLTLEQRKEIAEINKAYGAGEATLADLDSVLEKHFTVKIIGADNKTRLDDLRENLNDEIEQSHKKMAEVFPAPLYDTTTELRRSKLTADQKKAYDKGDIVVDLEKGTRYALPFLEKLKKEIQGIVETQRKPSAPSEKK